MTEEEEKSSEDAEETPVEEAPAEEPAAEEAPAEEEAPPEEPAAEEEAPAEEPGEEPPAAAEPPADDEEPEEVLTPKQLRKRARSEHKGEAKPQRGPEERIAERAETRKAAGESRRRTRARTRSKHQPGEGTPPAEQVKGTKQVRQGKVVSDKADKTIIVRVDVTRRHRRYGKIMRTSTKLHAHDERNDAGAGDTVRVVECRPMSRTKRWRLTDVLEKAK